MEKLVIGKIINTRGLKGEIKVENHSSFIKERYKVGNVIYLSDNEQTYIEKKIKQFHYTNGFVYLVLEGIEDIDAANLYRNYYIYCSSDDLKEKKDVYHFLTLKDMKVIYNGKVIGKIINIEDNTRQDLIRVDTGIKTFLIPFMDNFIKSIDTENKVMEVCNLGGLYED